MAKHKFISVEDGGYFYRFYPKIKKYIEPLKDPLKRQLLFAPPPNEVGRTSHLTSLYGKFLCKYHDKELVVELEQAGEIILVDYCTEQTETRILSSIIIQVPEIIYAYPFEDDIIYSITVTDVTLIKRL